MLYKMIHKQTPISLSSQIPQSTSARNLYNIRDPTKITPIRTRTNQHYKSFLPATIRAWNKLPTDTRNSPSLEQFKEAITPTINKPPTYYSSGTRKEQIIQSRMRTKNADLNENLHMKNLSPTDKCKCGEIETTKHYLIDCPEYHPERTSMLNTLNLQNPPTTELLLEGDVNLSPDENTKIIVAVQTYIKNTKRFETK